jgi:hypothetical protein
MPILLYVPKSHGGPFRDSTFNMPGVTRVVLTEKIREPYIPAVFDGRLILCTHGRRERPVILTEGDRWLTAIEFIERYNAHFQYLKPHLKRIDLFVCHTGFSGFAAAFADQLKYLMPAGPFVVNAPTAQFTIEESRQKWRIGMGQILPYVIGLTGLFTLGKFDRYSSEFCNMAWAGYPKVRRSPALKPDWTALSKSKASRSANLGSAWFGFGFKQFSLTSIGSLLPDTPRAQPDLGEFAKFIELPNREGPGAAIGREQSEAQRAIGMPANQGLGAAVGREQSEVQKANGDLRAPASWDEIKRFA